MKKDKKKKLKSPEKRKNIYIEERLEDQEPKSKKRKPKKKINFRFVFNMLFIGIVFAFGMFLYTNLTSEAVVVRKYFKYLEKGEYDEMYKLVSTDLSKEEFTARIKNIYEAIGAENITCVVTANTKPNNNNTNEENEIDSVNKNEETYITYRTEMDSKAGKITQNNTVAVEKVGNTHKIRWNSNMIFKELANDEKVRVNYLYAKRGYIYDRNGVTLAREGICYNVGIVPDKMDSTTNLNTIAKLLNISVETINNKINADYVGENTFVPLKTISKDEQELKEKLLQIKGIMVSEDKTRVYPYGQSTSMLLGYLQDHNGVSGIEQVYNSTLKGKDGFEIYTEKNGIRTGTIKKIDTENGKDIKITIDINLQQKIFDTFSGDKGASVLLNYNTGEVLALVSFPTYDSNKFSFGFTSDEWNALQNDENKPMFNRILTSYTPGSSIKPIVGAIGLSGEYFTFDEDFGRSGTKWQLDSSWKNLYVTTTETYSGPAILQNALIYSDNIYFAKAGIKIGIDNLQAGFNKFGFNSKIDFDQNLTESTYGKIDSSSMLASTSYGQGELLVNPVHMALMYSVFTQGGNMIKPYILYKDNPVLEYSRTNIISPEIANEIKEDLLQVVLQGTAKECIIEGKNIYGKTGTAEIKATQDDKNGHETGWFNAFDDNGHLIVSVIENVEHRGGSHYVVRKTKGIFEGM